MGLADRDRGLVQGVGALGLGAAVFNNVVGAGIFVLPAALARAVGPAAALAYLACVLAMGAVSLCFAAGGSRAPVSGGPYGVVEAAFGPFAGFIAGVLIWLGAVLASAGIGAAIVDGLAHFVPLLASPPIRVLALLALFGGLAAVNIGGVRPGARLVGLLTVAKLVPLLLLIGLALPHVKTANLAFSAPPLQNLGRAMILALFAFQGMETALGLSGEVKRPEKNVPLGLLSAMGAVAVLYILVQDATQGVLGPALGASHAPLADAMRAVAPGLVVVMLLGATVSMLGYMSSDALSAPRLLFAFASEGLLPRQVAALHPRSRAPWVAIVLHLGLAAALAASGSFTELVILSSLSTVLLYALGCVAAVRLQRRDVRLAGPPLRVPGLELAAVVGVLAMGWIAANAQPSEALGGLIALALSVLWYLVARRLRPAAPASAPASQT